MCLRLLGQVAGVCYVRRTLDAWRRVVVEKNIKKIFFSFLLVSTISRAYFVTLYTSNFIKVMGPGFFLVVDGSPKELCFRWQLDVNVVFFEPAAPFRPGRGF